MSDPYGILQLQPGATPDQVRQRYLELVRQHPPDREPQRFASIRAAYEQLRDPVKRLEMTLFGLDGDDSLCAIHADVQQRLRMTRIPTDVLLSLAEKP